MSISLKIILKSCNDWTTGSSSVYGSAGSNNVNNNGSWVNNVVRCDYTRMFYVLSINKKLSLNNSRSK